MFIQTEATPNPATLKFIPGRIVLDSGTMEFAQPRDRGRPLAARRKTVRSRPASPACSTAPISSPLPRTTATGSIIKPAILGAIMEHYMSGAPLIGRRHARPWRRRLRRGRRVLQRVRCRDGGDHQGSDRNQGAPCGRQRRRRHHLPRFSSDGIVYLNMKGSCAGCPSSTATLQHGIQNLLKHFVPDVVEVRPM